MSTADSDQPDDAVFPALRALFSPKVVAVDPDQSFEESGQLLDTTLRELAPCSGTVSGQPSLQQLSDAGAPDQAAVQDRLDQGFVPIQHVWAHSSSQRSPSVASLVGSGVFLGGGWAFGQWVSPALRSASAVDPLSPSSLSFDLESWMTSAIYHIVAEAGPPFLYLFGGVIALIFVIEAVAYRPSRTLVTNPYRAAISEFSPTGREAHLLNRCVAAIAAIRGSQSWQDDSSHRDHLNLGEYLGILKSRCRRTMRLRESIPDSADAEAKEQLVAALDLVLRSSERIVAALEKYAQQLSKLDRQLATDWVEDSDELDDGEEHLTQLMAETGADQFRIDHLSVLDGLTQSAADAKISAGLARGRIAECTVVFSRM